MNTQATWTPTIRRVALSKRVLVVARTRSFGAWTAHVDAVAGRNHDEEQELVWRAGTKLSEEFARVLFPEFNELPYAD